MNRNALKYLNHLWQSVIFWAVAMMLFGLFRYYGLDEEEGLIVEEGFEGLTSIGKILPLFLLTGGVLGVIHASIEFLSERIVSKRVSVGLRTLLKLLVYFVFIIIVLTLLIELVSTMYNVNINNERGWWRADKTFRVILLYIFVSTVFFSFFRISNEKFGKGVLIKMLLGKYREPIEEFRIFMFLDLKSSTTIAEAIGHFKYSQLIQDCFYDLNEIVPKYGAEIYQYVGDEVVLSWPYAKGLADIQCVKLFFNFQEMLLNRSSYYNNKYGIIPEFKAGMHGGKLMVAEVGVVKKELAFHGDVINTSARIQSECNNYGVPIILSESLLNDLLIGKEFKKKSLGSVLLKGKNKEVNIYTISKF